MESSEVYPNPVVKQVAFEIRFPNLFYLEGRIGDFQIKIMKDFPESSMAVRRHILYAAGESRSVQEVIESQKEDGSQKVWQFKSGSGVELALTSSSLQLISQKHKSYQMGDKDRFRDAIESVTGRFFEVTSVPEVTRIGLRYMDECPIDRKTTERFQECYHTAFPLMRFPLETASAMDFMAVLSREQCQLRYVESLQPQNGGHKLLLDFDAWAEHISAGDVMAVTDRLHDTISTEFHKSIKSPILDFMRGERPIENVTPAL